MVGTVADRLDLFGQQKTQGKTAIPFFSALEKWFSHFSGKCFLIDHIFIGIYYFLFCFPQIFWIFSIEFVFLFANFCIAIWHYLFSTNVSNIIRIKNKRESVPHKWQLSVLDTQCSLTELSLVEKHIRPKYPALLKSLISWARVSTWFLELDFFLLSKLPCATWPRRCYRCVACCGAMFFRLPVPHFTLHKCWRVDIWTRTLLGRSPIQ